MASAPWLIVYSGGPDPAGHEYAMYPGGRFVRGIKCWNRTPDLTEEVYEYTGICPRQRVLFARYVGTR